MGNKRGKTKYPGVSYLEATGPNGQPGRKYYIYYRRGGRGTSQIEEMVGASWQGMTEAGANQERIKRLTGKELSNNEKREKARQKKLEATKPENFGSLWNLYREAHKDNSSIGTDVSNYRNYLDKKFGKKPVSEFTTADMDKLRQAVEKLGKKPQTVKHILGQVRRVIRWGAKSGLCVMPANLYFNMPVFDNTKIETASQEQFEAYLRALAEEVDQDKAGLLKLSIVTGMRKGALLGLKWQDVDFERGLITLQAQYAKNKKTSVIPMNDSAREILQSIARQESDYVWPGRDGEKRKEFSRMARRVRDKAGLPSDYRPIHALRHIYASNMASSGEIDIYKLQKLMTHSDIRMTARYAHLADEALRKAANVASSQFKKSEENIQS